MEKHKITGKFFIILFSAVIFISIAACFVLYLHKKQSEENVLILHKALIKNELEALKRKNQKYSEIIKEKDTRVKEITKLAKEKEIKKILSFFDAVDMEAEMAKTDKVYIVISMVHNKLFIKNKGEIINEFLVSLGSGKVLKTERTKWIFETPRGAFEVIDKKEDPVWTKPDWAFIEKKQKVPPANSPKRIVKGYLGKYGIYLCKGKQFEGYIIHGTPEEDLIGLNVSHGCIRMKEEDLTSVYNVVEIGTPVIIR